MKYKIKRVDGHDVRYSSDWINDLEREIHFTWYYNQAKIIYQNCPKTDRILEIGPGTGLLSDMLKRRGWNIQTLDIDAGKNPDFCGDAAQFDYKKENTHTVIAFEVFEHIPFTTLEKILQKMSHSGVERICFSVPWNEIKLFELSVSWPRKRQLRYRCSIPRRKIHTPTHFWELAKKEKHFGEKRLISINTLRSVFEMNGYQIKLGNKVDYIQYFTASATS